MVNGVKSFCVVEGKRMRENENTQSELSKPKKKVKILFYTQKDLKHEQMFLALLIFNRDFVEHAVTSCLLDEKEFKSAYPRVIGDYCVMHARLNVVENVG